MEKKLETLSQATKSRTDSLFFLVDFEELETLKGAGIADPRPTLLYLPPAMTAP